MTDEGSVQARPCRRRDVDELLADRIARQARSRPAVRTADAGVDYAEFWTRVCRVAAGLAGMRRVAVLPTSDIDSLITVVAAMRAGVCVVLLHRYLTPDQLQRVLTVTRPGALVAVAAQHRRLRRMGFGGVPRTAAGLESDGAGGRAGPDSELLVGVTSGTTGEPKLFVRDQASWAATLNRSDRTFSIGPGDTVAVPGVLDHTHFLYGALHALTRGATVDLRPAPDALADGATHLYSVPTLAWDVVRSASGPYRDVREVLSSAARWPRNGRAAMREVLPNATITHFYGASELSFVSFDRGLGGADEYGTPAVRERSANGTGDAGAACGGDVDSGAGPGDEYSAGELFDGVEVEIRDGRVFVRSDMVFRGYLTTAGVVDGPVNGWVSVGDRGALDGRRLRLFGRDSEMFIRGGLNVEPAAVEAALTAIPGITEAACLGVADDRWGQVPVAAVAVDRRAPDPAEIRRRLRAVLPGPSVPVRIQVLDALPRTPRGKVDRPALLAVLGARGRHDHDSP
ncbi:class I adenylate-forming enzyme family protein [Nocardia carnea]|uniref:Class I adenylate-forming enzyme family protein n=1 Tax=Nocardia carnea TaxID=37328 RepID=A0ABW7TFI7_9NOCA|nr:AMP-binding protein [Nocardia carnea]